MKVNVGNQGTAVAPCGGRRGATAIHKKNKPFFVDKKKQTKHKFIQLSKQKKNS